MLDTVCEWHNVSWRMPKNNGHNWIQYGFSNYPGIHRARRVMKLSDDACGCVWLIELRNYTQNKCGSEEDVQNRTKWKVASSVLWDKRMPIRMKVRFYRTHSRWGQLGRCVVRNVWYERACSYNGYKIGKVSHFRKTVNLCKTLNTNPTNCITIVPNK